jgi:hypothetical protein
MALRRWSFAALAWLAGVNIALAQLPLHRARASTRDLEVGGDLAGVPRGATRFVRYADLLRLPQERFTAARDTNFTRPVALTGISLDRMPMLLRAAPDAQMITALCDDGYKSSYPVSYLQVHHPLLVLRIGGRSAQHWPRASDGSLMGPYMISHRSFTPAFQVLSHADEPQIPYGVIRLDVRRESAVYQGIEPLGLDADARTVQQGFTIARQNCFRCHNQGAEGGHKANRSWELVARRSVADPQFFDQQVRQPKSMNLLSQMPGNSTYDEATLAALRAYFRPFAKVPEP